MSDEEEFFEEDVVTIEDPEKVPQELLDKALEKMRALAKGNGIDPEDIEHKDFKGKIFHFQARQNYRITSEISHKDVNGREQGQAAGSKEDIQRSIQTHIDQMTQDKEIIQNTVQILKKRNDKGFAINNDVIRLDKYKKTYVLHSACNQCGGTAHSNCQMCRGQREVICQQCRGERTSPCPACQGTQFVTGPSGRIPCQRCHGRGRTGCDMCRQTGRIPCRTCKGSGNQDCNGCGATGWRSHVTHLQVKAISTFEYNSSELPEEAIKQIDALGPDLVTGEHAKVTIIDDYEQLAKESKENEKDRFHVNYHVKLPFGDIEFTIKDQPIEGKLFGYQPRLLKIPPFLETAISKGIRALNGAAHGKGNIARKIGESLQYRILSDILFETAIYSPKKAEKIINRKYRFGIRKKTIRDVIIRANRALALVTKKPRSMGLGIGIAAGSVLSALYLLTPLRAGLMSAIKIPQGSEAETVIDILPIVAGCLATFFAIRIQSSNALKKIFGDKLSPEQQKQLTPKVGNIAYAGYGGLFVAYLIMLEISLLIESGTPIWYEVLRHKIGL